ncbi:MAG: Wzz/FepE/Etk N-terminal domain-containing protein, partial [Methanothrix sp.]
MELKDVGRILWKNVLLILLVIFIAGGGVYYYSIRQAPIYQSTALLLLTAPTPKDGSMYQDILTMERQAKTFAEMLRSKPILESVSPSVNLSPYELSAITLMAFVEIYGFFVSTHSSSSVTTTPCVEEVMESIKPIPKV